jgi:hypothetical protein
LIFHHSSIDLYLISFCSLGQQYAFSRAYLNIPNRQDLIVFTEKFQGYVFVDKNGTSIYYPFSSILDFY